MRAASDADGGFGRVEMFREGFDESFVGLAVMRFGAKIDSELAWSGFNNFFLARAGFYCYCVFHIYIIQ